MNILRAFYENLLIFYTAARQLSVIVILAMYSQVYQTILSSTSRTDKNLRNAPSFQTRPRQLLCTIYSQNSSIARSNRANQANARGGGMFFSAR